MEGSIERADAWMLELGLSLVGMPYDADIDSVLDTVAAMSKKNWPAVEYMICGRSRTGCNHNVVYRNGEVVCDPVPGAGIVGPSDDGYTWVEFLVPVAGALNKLDRLRAGIELELNQPPGSLSYWTAYRLRALLEPQA